MNNLFYIFAAITLLFFILLFLKTIIRKSRKFEFCVICASISLTWISLLILFYLGFYKDAILIALLMGGSIVGVFYFLESLVEKTKKKQLKLFKLPFLLTLIFVAYLIISPSSLDVLVIVFLGILWMLFLLVFLYKKNKRLKRITNKLIECCKRW